MAYPIPNRKPEPSYQSGLTIYQLTDVERAYLEGGELHRIPTASERGLTEADIQAVPIAQPRTFLGNPKASAYVGKYSHITKELLLSELAKGKMIKDIAIDNNIPRGMMDYLFKINGIHDRRQHR
jgi:hypothetical protein